MHWTIETVSENAIIIYFSDAQGHAELTLVHQFEKLKKALQETFSYSLLDVTASYASLLLSFDVEQNTVYQYKQVTHEFLQKFQDKFSETSAARLMQVPVLYSAETGPDLERLAHEKKLLVDDIITLHSAKQYSVYALGFAPGFAYMGFVDETLASARLSTPRKNVAQGSVGIADNQTGIYPSDSPGGWNIIGRTPLPLVNLQNEQDNICLLQIGDRIQFKAISKEEYIALGGDLRT